ncbi:MAG: hypothetical protein ACE5I9_12980 [Candidatus Methylomirabilales bacterium]
MKRFAAFALALTLFAAPAVALADDYNGPSLEQIFGDNYVETILHGE